VRITSLITRIHATEADRRASAFAEAHFRGCEAHLHEAAAVHAALERICGVTFAALDPETTIRELAPSGDALARLVPRESLELVELQLAAKQALAPELLRALRSLAGAAVMKGVLGPVALVTSWDPSTVWARSVRGVINERVRHAGKCTCEETRS
jgi:hypothetical protein